jgi:hypothetical protein
VLNYHRENLITEKRVHDMVLAAMENNWDAIQAHVEGIRNIIEMVLRDGIEGGEFESVEPREASYLIQRSMLAFCHPLLIAEGLKGRDDLEKQARETIHFLLRAITVRS